MATLQRSTSVEPRISMTAGGVRLMYGDKAAQRVTQQIGWSRERQATGEVLFWGKVLDCLSDDAGRELHVSN